MNSVMRSGCLSPALERRGHASPARRSDARVQQGLFTGTQKRIQQNQVGLKKGYDPYDSGQLVKKEWKKKKDLRKLSAWIKSRKPKDE